LGEKLVDQDNKLKTQIRDDTKKIDQQLNSELKKLQDQLNEQNQNTNQTFKDISDEYNQKLKERFITLDKKLKDSFTKFGQAIDERFKSYEQNFNERFENIDEKIMDLIERMKEMSEDLSNKIERIKEEFNTKELILRDIEKKHNEENTQFKNQLKPVIEELKSHQDINKIAIDLMKKQTYESAKEWISEEINAAVKNKEREILMNIWIKEMKEIISDVDKLKEMNPKEIKLQLSEISTTIEFFKQKFLK
jgi:hypothetical protein